MIGLVPSALTVPELAALGVGRISIGSAFARVAYGALLAAATELREHGTTGFAAGAVPFGTINTAFAR